MRKIKIAQIGTSGNSHGNEVFAALKSAPEVFEIVGYALPENEREKFPERMKEFEGYREMTVDEIMNDSEIEAVTVETEEVYLTKYARLAAEHKKQIHMEKPGGTNLAEFEGLIETVKSNGVVFHTGYMYRYNPAISKAIDDARDGGLGEIISVEAQMNCRHSDAVRGWLKAFKGGMMFFLGCHLVDLVLLIKGVPKNIIPLNRSTGMNGITVEDYGMAVLEYDNGISFVKTCDTELGGFARRQLVITGTKKTIEIKPLEMYAQSGYPYEYTGVTEYDSEDWGDMGRQYNTDDFDRYLPMMLDFAEIVRGEKENPYTYDYELELYKAVLKCCGVL